MFPCLKQYYVHMQEYALFPLNVRSVARLDYSVFVHWRLLFSCIFFCRKLLCLSFNLSVFDFWFLSLSCSRFFKVFSHLLNCLSLVKYGCSLVDALYQLFCWLEFLFLFSVMFSGFSEFLCKPFWNKCSLFDRPMLLFVSFYGEL